MNTQEQRQFKETVQDLTNLLRKLAEECLATQRAFLDIKGITPDRGKEEIARAKKIPHIQEKSAAYDTLLKQFQLEITNSGDVVQAAGVLLSGLREQIEKDLL
jgi:hypothetical protein